ncbi:MAG: Wadjet anti-phage system protein JetA family protein, partial [Bacilli bacterium]
NAVKDDTKSLEFSGYVYNIYNNLYSFNMDHAVDIIEQVYNSARELNSMLRGLNVNIKKFLAKLISENKAVPKEILETIFFDYQKKVVLKAFKNFRERDNPSKYKLFIEDKIETLLAENGINVMINNYIKVKCDGVNTTDNYDVAKEFFETKLNYIRYQFEDIEEYIQMLDKRNTKYITTARSRLNFLLNEETDIEGKLIECLKGIEKVDDDFFDDSHFELFTGNNIDQYSLYNPSTKRSKPNVEQLVDNYKEDPEERERIAKKLFMVNQFSADEINKFVLSQLKDNTQIHAKDIQIIEFNDILKIFLAQLYSCNKGMDYRVKYLTDSYKSLGYQMKDYIIERKAS